MMADEKKRSRPSAVPPAMQQGPISPGARLKYIVSETWPFFFSILVPILLLPIILYWEPEKEFEKAPYGVYLTLLMAAFWVSECIPLAITSLIPIVLVPLFGINGSEEICGAYFNGTVAFLFGGCVVALAFEYSNLHSRISFFVMKSIGAQPTVLLFGMMMTCMLLSCWMNNTSTTAMMVPVIVSIMQQYKAKMIPKETAEELADLYGIPNEEMMPMFVESKAVMPVNAVAAGGGRGSRVEPTTTTEERGNISGPNNDAVVATEPENAEKEGSEPTLVDILQPHPMDESTISRCSEKEASVKYWENVIDSKKSLVRNLEVMFLIGVAVSSNIGGTGVVTGTATNLIAVDQLQMYKSTATASSPGSASHASPAVNPEKCYSSNPKYAYWDLDFLRWIILNFVGMVVTTFVSWIFLAVFYQGVPSSVKRFWRTAILRKRPDLLAAKTAEDEKHVAASIRNAIRRKYDELGRTTFHEWMVLCLFTSLVFLWIFKNPQFARGEQVKFNLWNEFSNDTLNLTHPTCLRKGKGKAISKLHSTWGWSRFIGDDCKEDFIHDYVATMLVCFLLFVLPKEAKYYKNVLQGGIVEGLEDPLLPMSFVAEHAPWGPVFMLGGGFAIANVIKVSKLGGFISNVLKDSQFLKGLSFGPLLAFVLAFVSVLTTIASNTATAVIVCPILIELARVKGVPPLYLVVPPIVGASYAFCLPISTPPNAIVYDKANMKQKDMLVPGLYLTVICNGILFFMTLTWTHFLLDVEHYPGYCNLNSSKGMERVSYLESDF